MEHRMKMTDIKTARTHGGSFPFLRANIQRLVGGGGGGGRMTFWKQKRDKRKLKLHKDGKFFKP